MGSDNGAPDEGPAHEVSIGQPFAIGVFETTREEMALYLNRGFEGNKPATQIDLSERDKRSAPFANMTAADDIRRRTGNLF